MNGPVVTTGTCALDTKASSPQSVAGSSQSSNSTHGAGMLVIETAGIESIYSWGRSVSN